MDSLVETRGGKVTHITTGHLVSILRWNDEDMITDQVATLHREIHRLEAKVKQLEGRGVG